MLSDGWAGNLVGDMAGRGGCYQSEVWETTHLLGDLQPWNRRITQDCIRPQRLWRP